MKSFPAMAASSPKKSFSSILNVRHITLRFAPSGNMFMKKGKSVGDLWDCCFLDNVTDIDGLFDAR